ncbi:MAG: transglycosylase SLT domain-containing protein [Pseudomonadota bacterium]
MKLRSILTLITLAAACAAQAQQPQSEPRPGDDTVLEMAQAFRQGNRVRLAQMLPQLRSHPLQAWGAYWELRARLDTATAPEVQDFFTRFAGTYQEDRLRNDWLLLLGQRRDWSAFADEHARFRMNDDTQVRCYALAVQSVREGASPAIADEVVRLWQAQRDAEDACTTAARTLYTDGSARSPLPAVEVWRKARLAMEAGRPRAVAAAVEIVAPELLPQVAELQANAGKFLAGNAIANSRNRKELVSLALLRLAATDLDGAARALDSKWDPILTPEERNWLWGAMGRIAAQRLSPDALGYFRRVSHSAHLSDEMLVWKVRAALRAGATPDWKLLAAAIDAMSPPQQQDAPWVYWRARALLAHGGDEGRARARTMFESIASPRGFYEQLALEELGQTITVPARPAALTTEEREAARQHPGLQRALYAIALGLRSEGVREWNYWANLHPGSGGGRGLAERELLAAAQLACEREVWDRCINTSERTRAAFDAEQRFPMPFREQVVRRSREIGMDPAYVYGLIRQESRFITAARSHVGASGLMQVMPATGRWTARKIGLVGFTPEQLNERDTNITIGTAYLKLALDDFNGSMPLAAAAYNAGPNRPRAWRNGPLMEAAAWAETVPFTETRDYVKKVLANTTLYAALITGQPQSLKARLGMVGPRDAAQAEPNRDLP